MESEATALFWLVSGIAVATCHLCTGALIMVSARPLRRGDWLFGGLVFVGAWYAFWSTLIHARYALTWPWMVGVQALLPGFIGPGLLHLTFHITHPERPPPRWTHALWPLGLIAFAYGLLIILDPALAVGAALDATRGDAFRDPTLNLLRRIHSWQLIVLGVTSLILTVHGFFRPSSKDAERLVRAWLGGILAAFGAIAVSAILPEMFGDWSSRRFGPLLTLPVVAVAWHAVRRTRETAEKMERQTQRMARFLPDPLRQALDGAQTTETLSGQTVEQTLLMVDVRGFTTLAEQLSPVEVVLFLNRFLGDMTTVVKAHGGGVDKFIGDCVLAAFRPQGNGFDARDAVRCAAAMLDAVRHLNTWWTSQGGQPIRVGIGVHRGRMVMGNIGSPEMMQFTVVGDTVNTVSRVEHLTRELDVDMLLTEPVYNRLDAETRAGLRALGPQQLRGKADPVSVWTFRT